jgi:hypothetical protein
MQLATRAPLRPHPATLPRVPTSLEVDVERTAGGDLFLRYVLDAPMAEIRVPPRAPVLQQRHLLWQHTCFEAFIALEKGGPYHELNLSPSGEWAVYAFEAYRAGAWLPGDALAPGIALTSGPGRLELAARVPLASLSDAHVQAPLWLALSAVVEDVRGAISYFALHHVGETPDFHHAEGFTLRLDAPT